MLFKIYPNTYSQDMSHFYFGDLSTTCQDCSLIKSKINLILHFSPPGFILFSKHRAPYNSSVGSVAHLRTGGRWFCPRLGQNSFRGLMIVIVTGFTPLSQLSVVSIMVMWESSQWLGKNTVRVSG